MKLADTDYDNSITGCCAPLDHQRWDRQTIEWRYKPFLKDHVREVMHIPLNYGAVMKRDFDLIEEAVAWPEHPFTLTDECSAWGADVYTAIDGPVPGGEVVTLSGRFLARAFDGPFNYIGRWINETTAWVEEQGLEVQHMYHLYATCPKCAKKLNRNDVVMLAKVGEPAFS